MLAPWPNRLEDGSYRFGRPLGRAPLDEPERRNAIHGLVRWMAWTIEDRSPDRANLSCVIPPQPAYPFRVRLELTYELSEDGLEVTCAATNTGPDVGALRHRLPPVPARRSRRHRRGARSRCRQRRRLLLDDRGLPVGEESVAGPSSISTAAVSAASCSTTATRASPLRPDGRWQASVDLGATRSQLWADTAFRYAMCYTGDTLDQPSERRRAIAIEPMTCPPNALRTGDGPDRARAG